MSRSNGPVTRGGSHHQDWQHAAEPDLGNEPAEAATHQPYQWPALFPQQAHGRHPHAAPQPGYDAHAHQHQPQGNDPYPPYHYPQDQYDQGHYGQDHYADGSYGGDAGNAHQPFATPAQHPPFFGEQQQPHAPQPNPYAPRYDGYPPAGAQGQAQAPVQRPDPYDSQGLAQLQTPGQARRPQATLRDQLQSAQNGGWQQPHAPREPAQPMHDPRDYDLGSYMPSADPAPPAYGDPHASQRGGQFDPHWQDPNAYGHPGAPQGGAADYYAQLGGEHLPVPEQGQGFEDPDADDADDYEYEEPRRGRRGLLIAGALVGAIMVGGGLAYGYKTIIGPAPKGTPPVIKADARPAKEQPEDPGGRQFAHSDSKLMGRLDSSGSSSSSSGSALASTLDDAESSGVRRVPTVIVGRDGSIAPPPAEPRLPATTVSVPGMTIVDGFGGRPTMLPQREERQRSAEVPPAPRIIARAEPEAQPSPPTQAAPSPPPPIRSAAVQPEQPVVRQPPPRQTAPRQPAPKQAAANPAPKSNPVGYVAVLASQKSRIDALKTFADLQQKYNRVLQNKIPDVLEADLSARGLGTMYRVVVGPPSSREAAADLCGQLKSAGFQGCWITAY